jgi:hypothetical protein
MAPDGTPDTRGEREMADRPTKKPATPGFVVLRQAAEDTWQFLGEMRGSSRFQGVQPPG